MEGSNAGWILVNSNEPSDTTASDKKGGTEINTAVSGNTATDGATVGHANSADIVSRATFGDKDHSEHNSDNIKSNGLWYYTSNGPDTTLGASTTDGAIYSQAYNTSWAGQIA